MTDLLCMEMIAKAVIGQNKKGEGLDEESVSVSQYIKKNNVELESR